MKNKRIDEILKSAFGELAGDLGNMTDAERSEHEKMRNLRDGLSALRDVPECQLSSEQLRNAILSRMTAAERSEHEKTRLMHEGLAALKDVPECQLSNERLRNAILGSAVKPHGINGWSLATAGLACAAIALIALRGMGAPDENSKVAFNDPAPIGALGPDNASAILGDQTKIQTTNVNEDTEPVRSGGAKTPEGLLATEPGPDYHNAKSDFDNVISNPSYAPEGGGAMTTAALSSATQADHVSIVVVDPNSRTRNGAARATEMDSYGDVVFGG